MPYKINGTLDTRIITFRNPKSFNPTYPFYCVQEATDFYDINYDSNPQQDLVNYCEHTRESCVTTAVIDKTNIQIPTFLPTDSALWLDADDSSTLTLVSGAVSEWRDKSGNNRHATQGTAGNRPLLVADGLNGTDVVGFNIDQYLTGVLSSIPQPFSIYCISSNLDSSRSNTIIETNNTRINAFYGNNSFVILFAGTTVVTTYQHTENDFNIINVEYDTNSRLLVDGNLIQSNINIGTNALGINYALAWNIGGNQLNKGGINLSQIIIFPRVLTQAEREEMEGYMAWKTGLQGNLPVGHPYKNSYTGVTVTETTICTDFYDFTL